MPYVHGLIHPKIFSDDQNAARATKTIIIPKWVSMIPILEKSINIGKLSDIPGIALVNITKKK